jgi:cytochrome c peroxidase
MNHHENRRVGRVRAVRVLVPVLCLGLLSACGGQEDGPWTEAELSLIGSLAIASLPQVPPDPSNRVADNALAVRLGGKMFSDKRLSGNGAVACSSCHQPDRQYTDGLPVAEAVGRAKRNTPSIIGAAWSPWQFWDGRKDSQWAQALAPMEDPAEHAGNRMALVRVLAEDDEYRAGYHELFGPLPSFDDAGRFPRQASPLGNPEQVSAWERMTPEDQDLVSGVFANLGKIIAAWERTVKPPHTRFDAYAEAVLAGDAARADSIFNPDEKAGLRLYIGEARCLECHNGPLFTNNEFHNTGLLPPAGETPDLGRSRVLDEVRNDPFNCLGRFSDASMDQCQELRYMRTGPELVGAHRTPSLRNLARTAPYMHKGQMLTLAEVLDHYNRAPLALVGHNEATPLDLGARELQQLEAFLGALSDAQPLTPDL